MARSNRQRFVRCRRPGQLAGLAVGPLGRASEEAAPAATPPTQTNVQIPVRDGKQLGADVYLPPGKGPFPVLLTITPYGKNGSGRGSAANSRAATRSSPSIRAECARRRESGSRTSTKRGTATTSSSGSPSSRGAMAKSACSARRIRRTRRSRRRSP